jgi:lactoylglutathione lyase
LSANAAAYHALEAGGVRRPLDEEGISLDCGRRGPQLRRNPLGGGTTLRVRIEHVAIWVADLEPMRAFYTEALGGTGGELYQNPTTGFRSYFISFGDGPRLELMYRPGLRRQPDSAPGGYAHMALALGSRAAVDAAVVALRERGVPIESEPRVTGDGYYEAIVLDPEHNPVELTV